MARLHPTFHLDGSKVSAAVLFVCRAHFSSPPSLCPRTPPLCVRVHSWLAPCWQMAFNDWVFPPTWKVHYSSFQAPATHTFHKALKKEKALLFFSELQWRVVLFRFTPWIHDRWLLCIEFEWENQIFLHFFYTCEILFCHNINKKKQILFFSDSFKIVKIGTTGRTFGKALSFYSNFTNRGWSP